MPCLVPSSADFVKYRYNLRAKHYETINKPVKQLLFFKGVTDDGFSDNSSTKYSKSGKGATVGWTVTLPGISSVAAKFSNFVDYLGLSLK